MNSIKAKLNSKRGVSIMLALLLFLICAFSGAAALTAASSNIGRYEYIREYQQQYLSISSAAKLLKAQFEAAGEDKITYNTATSTFNYDGNLYDSAYGLMWDELKQVVSGAETTKEVKFTVTVDDETKTDIDKDKPFDEVKVKATIKKDSSVKGTINVELDCEDNHLKFDVPLTFNTEGDIIKVGVEEVKRITLTG